MDIQYATAFGRGVVQSLSQFHIVYKGSQVPVHDFKPVLGHNSGQDKYGQPYPGVPQGSGFVQIHDAQGVGPVFSQMNTGPDSAVTVSVGLDHGHDFDRVAHQAPHLGKVVGQGVKIDLHDVEIPIHWGFSLPCRKIRNQDYPNTTGNTTPQGARENDGPHRTFQSS